MHYYFHTNGSFFISQSFRTLTACRKAAQRYARSRQCYVAIRRGDGVFIDGCDG